jgi:hypothetical protein
MQDCVDRAHAGGQTASWPEPGHFVPAVAVMSSATLTLAHGDLPVTAQTTPAGCAVECVDVAASRGLSARIRVWAGFAAWTCVWVGAHAAHLGGSWHYFRLGARLMAHGGASGGLHLYAAHPELQIGPLAFLVAAPFSIGPVWIGQVAAIVSMTAAGPAILSMIGRLQPMAARQRRLWFFAGVVFLPVWTELAASTSHLDDVLAVVAAVGALHALAWRRPVIAALLVAAAVDAKPWAIVFVPLLLLITPAAGRRLALTVCAVAITAAWMPFFLADPHTWNVAHYAIPNAPSSALRALGVHGASTPLWDRPAQLILGCALGVIAVGRGRPAGVLLVGMAARLLLDPSIYSYYTAGFLVACVAFDVALTAFRLPWLTITAAMFLYLLNLCVIALPSTAHVAGVIRLLYLVAAVGYALLAPTRKNDPRFAARQQTFGSATHYNLRSPAPGEAGSKSAWLTNTMTAIEAEQVPRRSDEAGIDPVARCRARGRSERVDGSAGPIIAPGCGGKRDDDVDRRRDRAAV